MDIFSAMSIIEKLYFKILLINIETDTFQEIKNEDILILSNNFSQSWKEFAKDNVDSDDAENYLNFINNLRDNGIVSYRRKFKDNTWHWVSAELIPYSDTQYLLFIRKYQPSNHRLAAINMIEYNNYHDSLTHCRNRNAYNIAINNINQHSYIVYLVLDKYQKYYNGGRDEDADRYVNICAKCIIECYGKENVYRIDLDKFVVITQQMNEFYFNDSLGNLNYKFRNAGVVVSFGNTEYSGKMEDSLKQQIEKASKNLTN